MNVNKKLSNIIFMAAFALFTWMWSDKYDGVITSVLGGIETESDIIDILGLGKWLFLFAVYFLILNKMLVDNRKTLLFSLYRYRDFKSWWKQYFFRLHITMFLYYLISCIVWYVIGVVTDNSSSHAVEIMIIFYMHLAMYFSIIAAADRILNKSIMPSTAGPHHHPLHQHQGAAAHQALPVAGPQGFLCAGRYGQLYQRGFSHPLSKL